MEHAFNGKQTVSWRFNESGTSDINLFHISSFSDNNLFVAPLNLKDPVICKDSSFNLTLELFDKYFE